jgi:MSHA biogenesis protein MshG
MPLFQYKARADSGQMVVGRIDATSPSAAAARLSGSGLLPIDIDLATEQVSPAALLRKAGFGKPNTMDLVLFTRQMYTIARAGLPWLRGLRGLAESTRQPALRDSLQQAVVNLEAGRDLSQSLSDRADVFPEIYISMVRVGEHTGTLETVFQRLADYLQNQQDMRDRVKGALRYPAIVLAVIVAALGVLSVFVSPRVAPWFKQLGDNLPLPTRWILAASSFIQTHALWIGAALVIGVIAFRVATRAGAGRYRWHEWRLRVPIFGKLLLESTLSRTVRTLSLTLAAGLPMIQALELIARGAENDYLSARLLSMKQSLESGEPISRAAKAAGIFPPLLVQMIEVGEETGELTRLLDEVADYYQREVDYTLKNLSALIEPVLMVVVGVMVLILALGIFLPMWEMIGKVSGGGG